MNYYKRHLGDYAKDTGHLTALQHGIYNLLLDYYYSTERPIPKDRAHRIARATKEQTQVVCQEFFKLVNDEWTHSRVDQDIQCYQSQSETNRAIAVAREEKKRAKPVVSSSGLREPSHKPLANSQEKKIGTSVPAFNPLTCLVDMDVPETVAKDFLKIRTAKRAPLTQTAIDGIKREAEKAGVTFAQAVRTAVERGWQGFKADWVNGSAPVNKSNNSEPPVTYWKAGDL